MRYSRFIQIANGAFYTLLAKVECMIVSAGHHVNTHPFEVFQQMGFCRHVGAPRQSRSALVIFVDRCLQIRKCSVRFP